MPHKLEPGEVFPELTLNLVGGGTLTLPAGLDAGMTILLFFRGHW